MLWQASADKISPCINPSLARKVFKRFHKREFGKFYSIFIAQQKQVKKYGFIGLNIPAVKSSAPHTGILCLEVWKG